MRPFLTITAALLLLWEPAFAASEAIFGLESVKLERVYDPNARPERLMLVSGSLQLVGGVNGNVWRSVTYIPQRTAAPRTDWGIFLNLGGFLKFYSFLTKGTYTGRVNAAGDQITIEKRSKTGQTQTEVWYIVR